jgi:uncharacterized protein (DUF983 family)
MSAVRAMIWEYESGGISEERSINPISRGRRYYYPSALAYTCMEAFQLLAGSSLPLILFIVVVGVLHLGSTVWTYSHAEKNDSDGFLWASIVFTLPAVGLIIYLTMGRGQLE